MLIEKKNLLLLSKNDKNKQAHKVCIGQNELVLSRFWPKLDLEMKVKVKKNFILNFILT
jgi:hypothetical protein